MVVIADDGGLRRPHIELTLNQFVEDHVIRKLPVGPVELFDSVHIRCRSGMVCLYVEGEATPDPTLSPPEFHGEYFNVNHEIVLRPGNQYTLLPGIRHWFRAGPEGAVVSEFSTRIKDDADVFTDPALRRFATVEED